MMTATSSAARDADSVATKVDACDSSPTATEPDSSAPMDARGDCTQVARSSAPCRSGKWYAFQDDKALRRQRPRNATAAPASSAVFGTHPGPELDPPAPRQFPSRYHGCYQGQKRPRCPESEKEKPPCYRGFRECEEGDSNPYGS
jgi:hypothetical protein